ncbi:MFS transporter [Pedobacter sp. Leaf176]|uniref:MFS transporter n=1 Tax=Pedobacter sp. Leaf176 TaxID=1736286 RepID=UPI0006F5D852|nr:MFS transporter [Pedobacter sp. Leaf176]KQR72420.1 MFS transporter [Pedobacter sp. Leaf176]
MEEFKAPQEIPDLTVNKSVGIQSSPNRVRLAVSLFYFGQGIAFASWASRIPDIKHSLNLSDGELGSILLALPLGQLFTMPVSGRLVTKYGSKKILTLTAPLYVLALGNLGLATVPWHLAAFLFLFGVIGNMCNIAVNTQGVEAEKLFIKPIMTSFHGAWSIAGFSGALIGLLMVNLHISPYHHFWIVTGLIWINVFFNFKHLVPGKGAQTERKPKLFVKPEGVLLQLGIIGFCSMATEGAMFDWSGVYFKEIVKAPASLVILGYASFMIMMASGRFVGDAIITKLGRKHTIMFSGIVISTGMFISVFFPFILTATIGFMLVGIGVSSIVPTVYSVAGKNGKTAPGMAIAMVSSVSYLGFLMGPPLIGYISALSSLRYSYAVIGCFGLLVSFLVTKIKAIA